MRISDWSSDVCSSDLFAPLPCCALALAGLRRIGCRAVAQTGVAANPIVRTLPDGRQVLFGLTRGDFTTRTATAPKDGKSAFAVMPQRNVHRDRHARIVDATLIEEFTRRLLDLLAKDRKSTRLNSSH